MISFRSKISLFIASFSPIWFILIGSYLIDDHTPFTIITSFLIILGIIASIVHSCNIFAQYRQSINMEPVTIKSTRDVTHKYATQIVAYVFFVLIDVISEHNLFVIISLAFFICIIFSRTNIILTNPTFLVVGFKLYEVKVTLPNRTIILLSRYHLRKGDEIGIKEMAPEIFIDKLKYD